MLCFEITLVIKLEHHQHGLRNEKVILKVNTHFFIPKLEDLFTYLILSNHIKIKTKNYLNTLFS